MLASIMDGDYEVDLSKFAMVHHVYYYHEHYVYFSCSSKPIRMNDKQWEKFKKTLEDWEKSNGK